MAGLGKPEAGLALSSPTATVLIVAFLHWKCPTQPEEVLLLLKMSVSPVLSAAFVTTI